LSKEEIDNLVKEAEKYKAEDEKAKESIEAKNQFESYVYSVKSSIGDEKLKDQFTAEEKTSVTAAVEAAEAWLREHDKASKEEYDAEKKKIEDLFNPIMTRVYAATGGQGMPGGMSGGMTGGMPGGFPGGMPGGFPGGMPGGAPGSGNGGSAPTVDEVD